MKTITLKTVKIAAILIIFIAGTTSIFAQSKEANPNQEISIDLGDETGIWDNLACADSLMGLEVYYSEGNINVEFQNNSILDTQIEIHNISGRLIYKDFVNKTEKNVDNLLRGIEVSVRYWNK